MIDILDLNNSEKCVQNYVKRIGSTDMTAHPLQIQPQTEYKISRS